MHIHVDLDLCQSHGQCVFAAPDHFAFDADDRLIVQPHLEPTPDAIAAVRAAATACPVAAITLTEAPVPR